MGLATTKDNGSDDGSQCCLTVWHAVCFCATTVTHTPTQHTHTQTVTLLYASIKATCCALQSSAQFQGDLFMLLKDFPQTPLDTSESPSQGFTQVHTRTRKTSKQWQAGLLMVPECIFGPLNHNMEILV